MAGVVTVVIVRPSWSCASRLVPTDDLRDIAGRYRAFVRRHPIGYGLLYANLAPGLKPDDATLAGLGRPIVATTARLVGESGALTAARTLVAWAHGFLSMELAGAFRLGGELDAAFADGLDVILAGIVASRPARTD